VDLRNRTALVLPELDVPYFGPVTKLVKDSLNPFDPVRERELIMPGN
jgi:hypothetical protein